MRLSITRISEISKLMKNQASVHASILRADHALHLRKLPRLLDFTHDDASNSFFCPTLVVLIRIGTRRPSPAAPLPLSFLSFLFPVAAAGFIPRPPWPPPIDQLPSHLPPCTASAFLAAAPRRWYAYSRTLLSPFFFQTQSALLRPISYHFN